MVIVFLKNDIHIRFSLFWGIKKESFGKWIFYFNLWLSRKYVLVLIIAFCSWRRYCGTCFSHIVSRLRRTTNIRGASSTLTVLTFVINHSRGCTRMVRPCFAIKLCWFLQIVAGTVSIPNIILNIAPLGAIVRAETYIEIIKLILFIYDIWNFIHYRLIKNINN